MIFLGIPFLGQDDGLVVLSQKLFDLLEAFVLTGDSKTVVQTRTKQSCLVHLFQSLGI